MPQMAPLSWTILFCAFLTLYLINTVKVYFTNTYTLSSVASLTESKTLTYSWKW